MNRRVAEVVRILVKRYSLYSGFKLHKINVHLVNTFIVCMSQEYIWPSYIKCCGNSKNFDSLVFLNLFFFYFWNKLVQVLAGSSARKYNIWAYKLVVSVVLPYNTVS